jgi:hypothetical protein
MSNFSWKIQQINLPLRCMVVEYIKDGMPISLNIPMPQSNDEIITTINQYAPFSTWEQTTKPVASVIVGMTGTGISLTDKPLLDQLKDKAKGKINLTRELIIKFGVEYKGHQFASDEQTISRLSAIITSTQLGSELQDDFAWRSVANEMIVMTLPELVELLSIMTRNVSATYAISWEKKQQIDKSVTEQEIAAVTWATDALKVIL